MTKRVLFRFNKKKSGVNQDAFYIGRAPFEALQYNENDFYFIDYANGNDTNTGTRANPLKTVFEAFRRNDKNFYFLNGQHYIDEHNFRNRIVYCDEYATFVANTPPTVYQTYTNSGYYLGTVTSPVGNNYTWELLRLVDDTTPAEVLLSIQTTAPAGFDFYTQKARAIVVGNDIYLVGYTSMRTNVNPTTHRRQLYIWDINGVLLDSVDVSGVYDAIYAVQSHEFIHCVHTGKKDGSEKLLYWYTYSNEGAIIGYEGQTKKVKYTVLADIPLPYIDTTGLTLYQDAFPSYGENGETVWVNYDGNPANTRMLSYSQIIDVLTETNNTYWLPPDGLGYSPFDWSVWPEYKTVFYFDSFYKTGGWRYNEQPFNILNVEQHNPQCLTALIEPNGGAYSMPLYTSFYEFAPSPLLRPAPNGAAISKAIFTHSQNTRLTEDPWFAFYYGDHQSISFNSITYAYTVFKNMDFYYTKNRRAGFDFFPQSGVDNLWNCSVLRSVVTGIDSNAETAPSFVQFQNAGVYPVQPYIKDSILFANSIAINENRDFFNGASGIGYPHIVNQCTFFKNIECFKEPHFIRNSIIAYTQSQYIEKNGLPLILENSLVYENNGQNLIPAGSTETNVVKAAPLFERVDNPFDLHLQKVSRGSLADSPAIGLSNEISYWGGNREAGAYDTNIFSEFIYEIADLPAPFKPKIVLTGKDRLQVTESGKPLVARNSGRYFKLELKWQFTLSIEEVNKIYAIMNADSPEVWFYPDVYNLDTYFICHIEKGTDIAPVTSQSKGIHKNIKLTLYSQDPNVLDIGRFL